MKPDKCPREGCNNEAQDSHRCPYLEELSETRKEEECNCCAECQRQCGMDI